MQGVFGNCLTSMGFTGIHRFFRRPHASHTYTVIHVRQGGMRRYMERRYRILATDEHRLVRLLQWVRGDMAGIDKRVNTGALMLVDSATNRPVATVAALDRLVGAAMTGTPATLVYTVDTSRAPMTPVQLPPLPPLQPVGSSVTPLERVTPQARFDELRRTVAAQLGTQLARGDTTATAVHNAAIDVLRGHRDTLRVLGLSMPSRTANSIAADLAVSVTELNPAVVTPANAVRVYSTTVEKSPAWNGIACHLAHKPSPLLAVPDTENDVLFDLEPEPALVGARVGGPVVVQLPVAHVSSAMPMRAVHTIEPLGAWRTPDADQATALARVGFRPHTAADYTAELVGACTDCQAIGRYRCGRRCRRHLRRLQEKLAFKKATTPAVPAVPKPIAGRVEFAPLAARTEPIAGRVEFAPLASTAGRVDFVPLAKPDDIQFVPLTAAHLAAIGCNTCGKHKKGKKTESVGCDTCGGAKSDDIQYVPLDGDDIEYEPLSDDDSAPLDDVGIEYEPLGAEAAPAALNLAQAQPARVVAQVPAGYRVWLRDSNATTAVGEGGVEIRGGLRHVELENPAGLRRAAQAEPLLFPRGQTSTIRLAADANGAIKWSCTATSNIGAQLAASLPAVNTPVPAGHMLLVHTDGTAASAPMGAWTCVKGNEFEARATNGRSYFFDGSRCLVADADNTMHNVLAVVPHPAVPGATVVVLPPLAAPRSE